MKHERFIQAMNELDDDLIAETYQGMRDADAARMSRSGLSARERRWMAWEIAVASFFFLLTGALMLFRLLGGEWPAHTDAPLPSQTVIAIDVNPGIELELDGQETVVAVRALNRDAEILLQGITLEGTLLASAVDTLMEALVRSDYLTDANAYILISVDNEDAAYAEQLQNRLCVQVTDCLRENHLEASVITQLYDKNETALPTEEPMSPAKAALVRRIWGMEMPLLDGVTYEELSAMSVQELNEMVTTNKRVFEETYARLKQAHPELLSPEDILSEIENHVQVWGYAPEEIVETRMRLYALFDDLCLYVVTVRLANDGVFRYEMVGNTASDHLYIARDVLEQSSLNLGRIHSDWNDWGGAALPTKYHDRRWLLENLSQILKDEPEFGEDYHLQSVLLTGYHQRGAVYVVHLTRNGVEYKYTISAQYGGLVASR